MTKTIILILGILALIFGGYFGNKSASATGEAAMSAGFQAIILMAIGGVLVFVAAVVWLVGG